VCTGSDNADIRHAETGAAKPQSQAPETENYFSMRCTPPGAKGKQVPCILKHVRDILKYLGHVFCTRKTRPVAQARQASFPSCVSAPCEICRASRGSPI